MASLHYSFWNEKNFPGFENFFHLLANRNYYYYLNQLRKGNFYSYSEHEKDEKMLDTIMKDFEQYYAALLSLGIVTNENFTSILKQLKTIGLIKLFPVGQRKYYGLTVHQEISINPDIKGRNGLSEEEVKQLILSHELSHILNRSWVNDMRTLCAELNRSPRVRKILRNMDLSENYYLEYGFSLLDEVVAEETAEKVTYFLSRKDRPKKEVRRDKAVFNYQPYSTNYVFYGELQDIAIRFARTLSFLNIERQDSDDDVLMKLIQASFSPNFIQMIRQELISFPNKLDSFVVLLGCMGRIREATYHVLGLSADQKPLDVTAYLDCFERYSKQTSDTTKTGYSFLKRNFI